MAWRRSCEQHARHDRPEHKPNFAISTPGTGSERQGASGPMFHCRYASARIDRAAGVRCKAIASSFDAIPKEDIDRQIISIRNRFWETHIVNRVRKRLSTRLWSDGTRNCEEKSVTVLVLLVIAFQGDTVLSLLPARDTCLAGGRGARSPVNPGNSHTAAAIPASPLAARR